MSAHKRGDQEMRHSLSVALLLAVCAATPLHAQHPPGEQFSRNMKLVSHIPLAGPMEVADIEVEQDLSRPYAYVSRMRFGKGSKAPAGFQIIDMHDAEHSKVLYSWFI